jgi:hypothetical protein
MTEEQVGYGDEVEAEVKRGGSLFGSSLDADYEVQMVADKHLVRGGDSISLSGEVKIHFGPNGTVRTYDGGKQSDVFECEAGSSFEVCVGSLCIIRIKRTR